MNMAEKVVLDDYNSDLNMIIDNYGYSASTLNHPLGFRLLWAGARATHGVCKGKAFFEVRLEAYQDASCDHDHLEGHSSGSHLIRVGWSSNNSSFALGEDDNSFGYGGTGKFSSKGSFADYGGSFGKGDTIGAMLDLESRPPRISFMKNGQDLGTAASLSNFKIGNIRNALFPHVFSKNCKVTVNFGQCGAWFPPPRGFRYMEQIRSGDRVRGATAPSRKSECETIMTVGLPGSGKTTWATTWQKRNPDKHYNIIGTDALLDQMKVMGVNRVYANRWAALIEMATSCFNSLLRIAASRNRNYILDQTNVYASARRRKLAAFSGFRKIAVVVQPDDAELRRRTQKRTRKHGKDVPFVEVSKMKANYSLPELGDELFDRIEHWELPASAAATLVSRYNRENARYKN